MRMIKEGTYDLVVANPPYQGTAKIESADYVEHHYSLGKADLYAAFLLRGLQLVREDGTSSMLTMRNWMFIKQYAELREHLLTEYDVRTLGDFDRGAFEDIRDEVVSVVVSVVVNRIQNGKGIALCPTCRDDRSRDSQRTQRKRAATLCHVGLTVFDTTELKVVPEWPVIYWWDSNFLDVYSKSTLLGSTTPASKGLCTGDETRLTRSWWEAEVGTTWMSQYESPDANDFISKIWFPYIKGGKGKKWIEPFTNTVNWYLAGLCIHLFDEVSSGVRLQNLRLYFRRGIAFTKIGSTFECRAHRYLSIFGDAGQSVFPINIPEALVLMNSKLAESTLKSLNPTPNFTPGDINRLPIVAVDHSSDVYATLTNAFAQNEYGREPSVEFKHPGPSPWRYAQEWAQLAVDRAEGEPLPEYVEQLDPEPPTDHISFAVGVALGRFGAAGEGILDPITADLTHALPAGVLFLDGTLADSDHRDSLGHSAAKIIHNKWAEFGAKVAPRVAVRDWLREKFFGDVHRKMYENRPIHWPLSSSKKTFVAWVNIHRMNGSTLRVLLADHLQPTLIRLEGELQDLRGVRDGLDKSASRDAEKRFAQVLGWRDELAEFIRLVEQCGEKGAPPTDAKCPAREVDARYEPDLDDGVMINSAALWPLLEPQWKDPKKWWKELCIASPKGNKDYDWSHLAMRYWPTRVDKKCQADPSLGVAHGCFWKYHPERAWAWELRLQDEIEQGFRIQEASYRGDGGDNEHRDTFLANHPDKAFDAIDKELTRRIRKSDDPIHEMRILEPGIWSALPHRCFALELRRSSTDSHDFRLHAPDSDSSRDQFLRTRTGSAASLVRAELLNRCSSREPLAEYRLPDSGLWLGAAEMCWALEREITRNQGEHAFQLVDPDSDVCRAEFVSKHSDAAMKIVALDIRSRSLTKQKPLASYTVTESGLWANCAAECYAIELEVIAKQKAPFRLIDPDHESLRAKYEKSSPEKAAERKALLDKFCPPVLPGMDSDPEPEPKKRKPRRTAK